MTLTEDHDSWVREVFGLDMSAGAAGGAGPASGGGGGTRERRRQRKREEKGTPDEILVMWTEALTQKNWAGCAFAGSAMKPADLAERVNPLSDADVTSLYFAAVEVEGNPNGPMLRATRGRALASAMASHDWTRIATVLEGFGQRAIRVEMTKLSAEDSKKLHDAAVAAPKLGQNSAVAIATGALVHPVLGTMQQGRAASFEKNLSPEDSTKYHALLDGAKSAPEKQFITKGLAANHSVAELEAFAQKIAGKSADWMRDNLSLTGNSDGKGIKQQWHDSCGPTTFEAVQGELDPLYALKMHEDNKKLTEADDDNARKLNPKMAADQKTVLTSDVLGQRGVAVNRDQSGGKGMWIGPALDSVQASTGLVYSQEPVPAGAAMSASVSKMAAAVAKGEPVPILIGAATGNQLHYVLLTATEPGPPRLFVVHDPWDGKTVMRTEEQIKGGKIDLAGWNVIRYVEMPRPAPPPARPAPPPARPTS